MSVRIEEVGSTSLDRVNKILAGVSGGVWKVAHGALKRAGDTAKTRAGQFAAEEYTINKGSFMKHVTVSTSISNASGRGDVTAIGGGSAGGIASLSVRYAGKVLPLLEFNTKISRNGLLTTQVKRSGGAATLQHAFAERVFGPIAVFERVGSPRFPVEQKFGPSTAHMMQNEEVIKKMDETIRETNEKRVEHEITRVLNGWGK